MSESDVNMEELVSRMGSLGSGQDDHNVSQITAPSSQGHSNPSPGRTNPNAEETIAMTIAQQFSNLSAAMTAQGVFNIVKTFDGEPSKFKQWIKDIDKYAKLVNLNNEQIPNIAYQTSTGSVCDFIKRYLETLGTEDDTPSWEDLKKLLKNRFAEITDAQQAMALLRKTKQKDTESVQIYSERLLQVAEDAYPDIQEDNKALVQRQLVDAFVDGLAFEYLKMKVMREDPKTLEDAISVAMKEQNLRKRFNLRKQDDSQSGSFLLNPTFLDQIRREPLTTHFDSDPRNIEPMEIDHYRPRNCFKCRKPGHTSRNCPNSQDNRRYDNFRTQDNRSRSLLRPNVQNRERIVRHRSPPPQRAPPPQRNLPSRHEVQVVGSQENQRYDRTPMPPNQRPPVLCWHCNQPGHLRRNCPHINSPPLN